MIDNLVILTLIVLSFVAGLKLDRYYFNRAEMEKKDALERQFLRLRARADADDPCGPYIAQPARWIPQPPPPVKFNTGDFDGDGPIGPEFMKELKTTGKAKATFRKSDVTR